MRYATQVLLLMATTFCVGCGSEDAPSAGSASSATASHAAPSTPPQPKEAVKDDAVGKNASDLPKQLTVDLGGGMKLEMVLIPAGEFMMGSKESSEEQNGTYEKYGMVTSIDAERPPHHVRITKPFYLAVFEVTVGQFRQFAGETGYSTTEERDSRGGWGYDSSTRTFVRKKEFSWRNPGFPQTDDHPVVDVDWNDALAFCKWLSQKEGKKYRLPTEAEWEYACRAGTTTRYYNGDDPERLPEVGNIADAATKAMISGDWLTIKANDGYAFTSPVGRFKPNAFGLYDMHGNAAEWCDDWFDYHYYEQSPTDDPKGPDSGEYHVVRGGSCLDVPQWTRSAYRNTFIGQDLPRTGCGFRIARSL